MKNSMNQEKLQDLSVEKDAWISLSRYFDGRGTESEAKTSLTTLGVLTKKLQARNNERKKELQDASLK